VLVGVVVQVAVGVTEGPPGVNVGAALVGVAVKLTACWWVMHNSGC
jgi:hypothetical protein